MKRSSKREAAKNEVIASGNAQAVLRRLEEIEEDRGANLSRWVWELLQNARDAAGGSNAVRVSINYDGTLLTFQHDGPPFRDEELAHLIFHGSTKRDGIGRFGTGFISTHLLSRVVRIRGPLDDGTVFDFDLDRTGSDPDQLKASMDRSWKSMNASLRDATTDISDRYTTFSYSLGAETLSAVAAGISSLDDMASLVLAFNPQFSSLSITANGRSNRYTIDRAFNSEGKYRDLRIIDQDDNEAGTVLVLKEEDVSVAVPLAKTITGREILFIEDMPRLFVAFPLIGTARYPLPVAINSEHFHPRTERDGIWLESEGTAKNMENRSRFEQACRAFGPLIEYAAQSDIANLTELLVLKAPIDIPSVNSQWLMGIINTHVVADLSTRSVLLSRDVGYIAPRDAIIPFARRGSCEQLWNTISSLKVLGPKLPRNADLNVWNEILLSWSHFGGLPPEQLQGVWSIEKVVCFVANCKTVSSLANEIDGDVWQWISALIHLLEANDKLELADNYAIMPDQNGDLKPGGQLLVDDNLQTELKDLAEDLGLPGRAELLATELEQSLYAKRRNQLAQETLLHHILNEIVAEDGKLKPTARGPAISLFCFVVSNKLRTWLERIPIVTATERLKAVKIKLGSSFKERLLTPSTRWYQKAREFGELFPAGAIFHVDYGDRLKDEDWKWLSDQQAVFGGPLVFAPVLVEDFLDLIPTDADRDEVRSKDKVKRLHVMYFSGDDSVLESARKDSRVGILLVRFLLEVVIPIDKDAFTKLEVECDDNSKRSCFEAAWLAPLLTRRWVKTSEKRAAHFTTASLAELVADRPDLITLLLKDENSTFLMCCNISRADLAFRSVAKTESDRMSLIHSLGIIADAVGREPSLIARFAETIQADSKLIEYVNQRRVFIDRIIRNQSYGFAVEREFKSAFNAEPGIKITRTGHGHDFVLQMDAGEENDAGRVEIGPASRTILLELKATQGSDAVYMSVRQVEMATQFPDRYWLCVVGIAENLVESATVQSNAHFVLDIGILLKDAWKRYQGLRNATTVSTEIESEATLEVSGQEIRFRIGRGLWAKGVSFSNALLTLQGRFAK